jgi:hypothetical protein
MLISDVNLKAVANVDMLRESGPFLDNLPRRRNECGYAMKNCAPDFYIDLYSRNTSSNLFL